MPTNETTQNNGLKKMLAKGYMGYSNGFGNNCIEKVDFFAGIYTRLIGSEIRPSTKKMYKTLKIHMGYLSFQLVQDFFHQQYVSKGGGSIFNHSS